MSKTVEIQIEKSRSLVEGLRRHVKEMGERGVTNEEINAMEQSIKELEAVNAEVDSIREQLTPTVAKLKLVMDRVKEAYTEKKKTLKGSPRSAGWTTVYPTSDRTIGEHHRPIGAHHCLLCSFRLSISIIGNGGYL